MAPDSGHVILNYNQATNNLVAGVLSSPCNQPKMTVNYKVMVYSKARAHLRFLSALYYVTNTPLAVNDAVSNSRKEGAGQLEKF